MVVYGASLDSLRAVTASALVGGNGEVSVRGITYDSRTVKSGDLFVALVGAEFDGHEFIDDALTRGAAALLLERAVDAAIPQLVVENSRAALSAIANEFYGRPSHEVGVIGITGTDGKTTTSFITDHILRSAGNRTGLIGTIAIRVGDEEDVHASRQTTPESNDVQKYLRQMALANVRWAIIEATSHGLAMHRLDHVEFQIGAVTNITHEHLDFHGSIGAYRRAKGRLLERVASNQGTVVLNADDEGALSVEPLAEGASVVRYSARGSKADVCAIDIAASGSGSQFQLDARGWRSESVTLPLIGSFNVENALCAAGIALAAGIPLTDIAAALYTVPPVPGRLARIDLGQPFNLVVDYAHTPDSLSKVLTLLRGLNPDGRLIAVFGSAGERDVAKRPLQGAASARLADITIVTSEDPRNEDPEAINAQIVAGAESAGGQLGVNLFSDVNRRDALTRAIRLAQPGDCILLAGKGHEQSIIWGTEKHPWDEATVARELLIEAGYGAARP